MVPKSSPNSNYCEQQPQAEPQAIRPIFHIQSISGQTQAKKKRKEREMSKKGNEKYIYTFKGGFKALSAC